MRFLARSVVLILLVMVLAPPKAVQAQNQVPSLAFLDQITAPYTDAEIGGIGCLSASAVTGGMLVYLTGGFGRIATSMQGPIPPLRVMEGAAAVSFIFSSVCYIGAALAPLAMMAYNSIVDSIPDDLPSFLEFDNKTSISNPDTSAPPPTAPVAD